MRFNRRRRNRTERRINIDPKYIFGFLGVLALVLIFCSFKFADKFAPFKTAVGNFVTPMQRGINNGGEFVASKLKKLSSMEALIAENEELKARIDELENENSMLNRDKYELGLYRDLYELDAQYSQYSKIAAKVISREPNNFCNVFIVDKGSRDGIMKDMNVIAGNGLVGIVTEVGSNWAKVRSIIDDDSSVSGMFLKTSDTCVVSGDMELMDDGYIRVGMISLNAEIYENYEIVTSYISNKYLPGIMIGYVSNIHTDPSTMAKEAYLAPVADFEHIDAVFIITQLREKYDDLSEVLSSDN